MGIRQFLFACVLSVGGIGDNLARILFGKEIVETVDAMQQ